MTAHGDMDSLMAFRSDDGGMLLVDKPREWTSFDVVRKVRGMLRVRKIGHAGTLDPLATGLLILASGKHTKSIDSYQAQQKIYSGTMLLGAVTASYDAAMPPVDERPLDGIDETTIRGAAATFVGAQMQVPPMFAALKQGGRRLYTLARAGIDVAREPRAVHIHRFEIEAVDLPRVTFTVECSKGTYVRSLAHDLGQALGCGAYLETLRREAIGEYRVENAWTLEQLSAAAELLRPAQTEAADAGR